MNRSTLATAVLLSAFASGQCLADEAYNACMNTQKDDSACGAKWIEREDASLKAVWDQILPLVGDTVKSDLLGEQQAWLAFKDTSCAFKLDEGFAPGGDKAGYYACRAAVITHRTESLTAYLKYIDN